MIGASIKLMTVLDKVQTNLSEETKTTSVLQIIQQHL